jgi:hypothetical protein
MRTEPERRLVARIRSRASQRGAAMPEAAVVIAFLVIGWGAARYFHDLYLSKVRVARLARAAALHYAIDGCQGDVHGELAALGGSSTSSSSTESANIPYGSDPTSGLSSGAQSAVNGQSGVSGLGVKIVNVTADGQAAIAQWTGSTNTTSWVGCSDPTSDKKYEDILSQVTNAIPLH